VIDFSDLRIATIHGYTTSPTVEGETLEIKATEHLAYRRGKVIEASTAFTEIASTSVPGRTGAFSAHIESKFREWFQPHGTFTIVAINVTSRSHPKEVDRTTTEHVPISLDL
jgi:hypothetical protein